jgi:hypothetical protein
MTDKKKLEDAMQQRNPLKRDVVKPVDMYTIQQVDNPISKPSDSPQKPQVDKTTTSKVDKTTSGLTDKPTTDQPNKIDGILIRKYTTHLPPDMIKAIKQRALDTDRKDYEVMYEAISKYFAE